MIEPLIALIALSLMEIVLGIDNIVFISILTGKLPAAQQSAGRKLGLLLALGTRILLLSCIFWIVQLKTPIVSLSDWLPAKHLQTYFLIDDHEAARAVETTTADQPIEQHEPVEREGRESQPPQRLDEEAWEEFNAISWRDLILIAGGLFLIYSSVHEIHSAVEGNEHGQANKVKVVPSFLRIIIQIGIMDIVFSLDSVITAVGMADQLWVMITAVVLAVGVMILFANQVGDFVDRNPTIRMLAVSFLLLIGVMLVAEGIGTPIAKGYIYFAMAFSLFVESFNLKVRRRAVAAE